LDESNLLHAFFVRSGPLLQVVDNLLLSFGNLAGRASEILLRIFVSFGLIVFTQFKKGCVQGILGFLRALILNS
jgi:hypothetical protein